jgi:hypothetical protein
MTVAGEPSYRITRIIVEECRVFRTKARAPSLIVCEVMREDLHARLVKEQLMKKLYEKNNGKYGKNESTKNNNSNNGNSDKYKNGNNNATPGISDSSSKGGRNEEEKEVGKEEVKDSMRISPRKITNKKTHTLISKSTDSNDNNNSRNSILLNNINNENNGHNYSNNNINNSLSGDNTTNDGVGILVENSISATLAGLNLKNPENRNNSTIQNNQNAHKPYSSSVITSRKIFDGNECCGFSQNRSISVDDFRIIDNDTEPFTPSFPRNPSDMDNNTEIVINGNEANDNNNNNDNSSTNKNASNNAKHENKLNHINTNTETNYNFYENGNGEFSPHTPHTLKSISKKNNNSSLLSANRKSIFNFQTILTSASTDDFSLMIRGEKVSDIFEKTNKITRQIKQKQNNDKININNNKNNGSDKINSNKSENGNRHYNEFNNDHKNGGKSPGSPRLLPPPFAPQGTKTQNSTLKNEKEISKEKGEIVQKQNIIEMEKNSEEKLFSISVNSVNSDKSNITEISYQNVPENVPKKSHEDFSVGDIGILPTLTFTPQNNTNNNNGNSDHNTNNNDTNKNSPKNDFRKKFTDSSDRREEENIMMMKNYYDINFDKNDVMSEKAGKSEKIIDEKTTDKQDGNENGSEREKEKEKEREREKSNLSPTLSVSSSRPSSPYSAPPPNISSENVFRIAESLFSKNVTIQACRKLYLENRISKEEYEKLCRVEIHFLEEKARSEAIAATIRLKHVFGESWCDKKNRILGLNSGYSYSNYNTARTTNTPANNNNNNININININNSNSSDSNINNNYINNINNNKNNNDTNLHNFDDDESDGDEADFWPEKNLISFIVKSNDDLRQEVCCLQLMEICDEIFSDYNLKSQLYLHPYRIVSTGNSTGLVQVLTDTLSLDALKKTPGFSTLPQYFKKTFGTSAERLNAAKRNFASSLAAYSLFCHILQIKDRHNGNLLIDQEGHIIHIDFGFLLSIAPGML